MITTRRLLPRPNQSEVFYLMQCALLKMPVEEALANIEASRKQAAILSIKSFGIDAVSLGCSMMNSYIGGFSNDN